MDVLVIAVHDHANTGWRIAQCLKHIGFDYLALKGQFHPFHYPEQMPIYPPLAAVDETQLMPVCKDLCHLASKAKVIHYIGSVVVQPGVDLYKKNIVVNHGGSTYRRHHEIINNTYDFVDASVIQCPDLLELGAENEQWVYYPVDTDLIKPDFKTNSPLKVGHFPSNPMVKGSDKIRRVAESISGIDFICDTQRVIWSENLKRVAECDVLVETLSLSLGNEKYGEWGNAAIEAAAMGKIVITNSLTEDKYKEEFGEKPALIIANSESELKEKLTMLSAMSEAEINRLKIDMRHWVLKHHSIPATARRLWDKVYKDFF